MPAQQLPVAFSQLQARRHAAQLAGPPLACALYAVSPGLPFLAHPVSSSASAPAHTPPRTPIPPPQPHPPDPVLPAHLPARPGPSSFPPYTGALTSRDFTPRSLRGNAVLRWEYRPGSTVFLVWQQVRLNPALMADFAVNDALRTLFDASASNTLVLKWTYYLNP